MCTRESIFFWTKISNFIHVCSLSQNNTPGSSSTSLQTFNILWGRQSLYFPFLRYSTLKNETLVILLTNSVTQIWLGVHFHQTTRQLRSKFECTNILKPRSQTRSSRETLKPQSFFFQVFPTPSFRIFPVLKSESSERCTSKELAN